MCAIVSSYGIEYCFEYLRKNRCMEPIRESTSEICVCAKGFFLVWFSTFIHKYDMWVNICVGVSFFRNIIRCKPKEANVM